MVGNQWKNRGGFRKDRGTVIWELKASSTYTGTPTSLAP